MASYNFGYTKYVETPQGNLGLGMLNTDGDCLIQPYGYFELATDPSFYIENNILYYDSEYPNIQLTGVPNLMKVANFGATNLYMCLEVVNASIPKGTPITIDLGDYVRISFFCGDENGTKTEINPKGYHLNNNYTFNFWNRLNYLEWHGSGDPIITRSFTQRNINYFFINTVEGLQGIWVTNAPEKKKPIVIEDVRTADYYSSREIWETESYITVDNNYNFTGSFQILNLANEVVSIDILNEEVGTSIPGGGGGSYDLESDNILIPSLPTLGAGNCGLLTIYNPTLTQLRSLSNWLWSNSLLDNLEKMFAQPMDLIITLNLIPCAPQYLGVTQEVKIGGVGTEIQMQKVDNQYMALDCGTIDVKEFFGSALDYGIYTKVSLYLPFCNVVQLKTDEVMNAKINVTYHIDLFTGSCIAYVSVLRDKLNSVLYSFEGNLAVSIPLISRDFSNLFQSITKSGINALSGGFAMNNILSSAVDVMASKPNINRTGGVSSTGGLLGIRTPYLIIERPIQSLASNYNKYVGYPSNITSKLLYLKGFTQVEEVIANGLTCTDEEQEEIINLLKEGVIL